MKNRKRQIQFHSGKIIISPTLLPKDEEIPFYDNYLIYITENA